MEPGQRYRIGQQGAGLLEFILGDITNETTDAIVNAANSSLLGGGGVDGAIHRAAGPALLAECREIRAQRGPLPSGQAVSTSGANLRAKYVIHTVGPIWNGGASNEPALLESCYIESLRVAQELGCASVSFPSVSTGAYGYPVHEAAEIAVPAVAKILHRPQSVTTVRFVLFDVRTLNAYTRARQKLSQLFPDFQIKAESAVPPEHP
ncbi:MAG TPA: O-acetyl-ADP-ribose deacetylase [Candidatus Angelobacter sp.]|nr:O-acetyl-ADP-ribose deacetylase [Candidatus Angelobacter sp.]